jgi:hypothetical protein
VCECDMFTPIESLLSRSEKFTKRTIIAWGWLYFRGGLVVHRAVHRLWPEVKGAQSIRDCGAARGQDSDAPTQEGVCVA